MLTKPIITQNIRKASLFIFILLCISLIIYFSISFRLLSTPNSKSNIENTFIENNLNTLPLNNVIQDAETSDKKYIKWVDLKCNSSALAKLAKLDISSHVNNENIKYNWIELMAYLACKYDGDLTKFKQSDLDTLVDSLKSGTTMSDLGKNYKLYNYFYETYDAIFHDYIGDYTIQSSDENGNKLYKTIYGIKVFSPIAKNYSFSHYNDFGASRSYGYKRVHLGNDLLRKYWYSNYCCRIRLC